LRRIVIIGTALAVLVGAATAYAALNNYTAALKFSPTKAGTPAKPVNVGWSESLAATNTVAGSRAAPLIDIKTTIYGLKSNNQDFPTCTNIAKMQKDGSDSFCPAKALVATGPVNALLGSPDLTTTGSACNPFLHVWNAGKGKVWFFFTTSTKYYCLGLKTGQTAPYPGTIKEVGKNMVSDVPLPPDVSTMVAGHANFYGSLIKEVLTYKNLTTKVHGKTVGLTQSIGCKNGKRPWSVQFTAVSGTTKETRTVTGSAKCS
jgi:hypothetical protein